MVTVIGVSGSVVTAGYGGFDDLSYNANVFIPISTPDAAVGNYPVVTMLDSATTNVYHSFQVPSNYHTMVSCAVVVIPNGTGNMRHQTFTSYCGLGENYFNVSGTVAVADLAVTQNQLKSIDILASVSGVAAGDLVSVKFSRIGDHANDTVNADCYYVGLNVRYS